MNTRLSSCWIVTKWTWGIHSICNQIPDAKMSIRLEVESLNAIFSVFILFYFFTFGSNHILQIFSLRYISFSECVVFQTIYCKNLNLTTWRVFQATTQLYLITLMLNQRFLLPGIESKFQGFNQSWLLAIVWDRKLSNEPLVIFKHLTVMFSDVTGWLEQSTANTVIWRMSNLFNLPDGKKKKTFYHWQNTSMKSYLCGTDLLPR